MFHVTRSFEFDSAHRLVGYSGKCKHMHGHHYVAQVTMSGRELNELSMLVDFGVLKEVVGEWINGWWDHNIILTARDPLWNSGMPEINAGRMPYNMELSQPTAEAMAKDLFCRIRIGLEEQSGARLTNVRIYETPDCWVDYNEAE